MSIILPRLLAFRMHTMPRNLTHVVYLCRVLLLKRLTNLVYSSDIPERRKGFRSLHKREATMCTSTYTSTMFLHLHDCPPSEPAIHDFVGYLLFVWTVMEYVDGGADRKVRGTGHTPCMQARHIWEEICEIHGVAAI